MKKFNIVTLFLIGIGLMTLIYGCQSYHMHAVRNLGTTDLYDVAVTSKDQTFIHGVLVPKGRSGYSGFFELDKQNEVEISWCSNEGDIKKKRLKLNKNPGSQEVVFNIDGEDVTVTYYSY